jgi:3-deoxy-D-manno-octulosonic-acid transferase
MWSILHDIFVTIGGRLDLARREATPEYLDYRRGRRIGDLQPDGRPLIWLHGVSLGEVNALSGLLAELRKQTDGKVAFAISTMTEAGLPAARNLNPEHAFIYPLDLSRFAREIVKRLKPQALVIFDGDFWFQMMQACREANVPIVIVNGKLSESTAKRHGWFPSYAREMFSGVALASVQSATMAERFASFMPRERISVDGNIKLDLPIQSATLQSRDRWVQESHEAKQAQGVVTFVFGSIHPLELDHIAEPINRVLAERPNARVVIVPRHPNKFSPGVLSKYFPNMSSSWDAVSADAQLIWINKLGVLRELYQQADVAFVGGTFCDVGGHNLAEPALAGVPVLYGPDVHTQLPLHELLHQYGASKQVTMPDELHAAMLALIDNPVRRDEMSEAANRLRSASQGLTARIAARILEIAGLSVV